MLTTILVASLGATVVGAIINKITSRQPKIVIPQVVFVENRTNATPIWVQKHVNTCQPSVEQQLRDQVALGRLNDLTSRH